MEKMVPPRPARTIVAITDTFFAFNVGGRTPNVPSLAETGQAIPFFGMLLGLASIGHSVYAFPGTDDSPTAGCKGADLLVVDDAQIPSLAVDWKTMAAAAMRGPNIVVHDRATFQLKAG
jgi:hypothetical protein